MLILIILTDLRGGSSKNFKNIYLTETEGKEQWVLIIYDISPHHYVGVPVYNVATKDGIYLKSINKYVSPTEISDYSRYQIINPVYIDGKVLSVNNNDFNAFSERCKLKKLNLKGEVVIKRNILERVIKNDLEKEENLTNEQIDEIYYTLKQYANKTTEEKQAHIKRLKGSDQNGR